MSTSNNTHQALLDYLLVPNSREALQGALSFLLTPSELKELNNRLLIAQHLEAGIPQRIIAQELGVAIATVSRGARALKDQQRKANDHD